MKRGVCLILILTLLLMISCGRRRGMFKLHGTVFGQTDTILVVGLDSRFDRTDTLFCRNGQFEWSFRPDTVTTLILLLPDGRQHPIFAEKNVEAYITIPEDSNRPFTVTGGYCNDSYQSFYLASMNDSTSHQSAMRIDSFISRDPFSEVTPYLIYDQMVRKQMADQESLTKLIERMSGNMQDAPYITSLKLEFLKELPNNTYVSTLSLRDSAGMKHQFADMGGTKGPLLVYVWASWAGKSAIEGRRSLDSLYNKYWNREFTMIDISIDVNKERWLEAILPDTVEWDSYIDTQGWNSRVVRGSNTVSLPTYILFSEAKRVLLTTQSFDEMDKELDKRLPLIKDEKRAVKAPKSIITNHEQKN